MILDIIIILFLVFCAFSGYKKGLTTILVSLIGFVLAIILAFSFKSTLANVVINNTDLDTQIQATITDGINSTIAAKEEDKNEFYSSMLNNIGAEESIDELSHSIVVFILETIAFIFIFIVVKLISFIIQMMLNLVFDLPILSGINNMGGLVIGGVMGLFKVWIILAIISVFMPMFGDLSSYINGTTLTKFLYDSNIIVNILSGSLKL